MSPGKGSPIKRTSRAPRLERILEVFDRWRTVGRPAYGYEIKTAGASPTSRLKNEEPGGLLDPPPLRGAKRLVQILRSITGPRLDFDEDEHIAIGTNEVYLTGRAAIVARQHPIPVAP